MTATTKIQEKAVRAKTKTANKVGPELYQRNENGLIVNHNYEFNPDGSINWRAMIGESHLFPNRDWFKSRNMQYPSSTEGLHDHQLLIKLSGIKELARLRGIEEVKYKVVECTQDHVAVICRIKFIANYETGGVPVLFEDMANATVNNTSDFGQIFLETIACNRAFVRCVRNFLNIHIVGDDEINKNNGSKKTASSSIPSGITPSSILESNAANKMNCTSFEDFKQVLREWWKDEKYRHADASNWDDWSDIPPAESRVLLKLVNG